MSDQQCDFPRCKQSEYIGYIERNICNNHWEELCRADSKTEKKLLKKIGLIRNKNGEVVVINTHRCGDAFTDIPITTSQKS